MEEDERPLKGGLHGLGPGSERTFSVAFRPDAELLVAAAEHTIRAGTIELKRRDEEWCVSGCPRGSLLDAGLFAVEGTAIINARSYR